MRTLAFLALLVTSLNVFAVETDTECPAMEELKQELSTLSTQSSSSSTSTSTSTK